MDLKFDKLLSCGIKRLTRPKFKHEYIQLNDPSIFAFEESYAEIDAEWRDQGTFSNDIAYDGISSDASLSYLSSFGKIQAGEPLRVLLTVMNTSASYSLDNIKLKVFVCKGK